MPHARKKIHVLRDIFFAEKILDIPSAIIWQSVLFSDESTSRVAKTCARAH